jgi:hypothetical protein
MSPLHLNLQYLLSSLFILFVVALGRGLATTAPLDWTRGQKYCITMLFLSASYITMGLGLLGPYVERTTALHRKPTGF